MLYPIILFWLAAPPANWPDLVQKPYSQLPTPDLGLRPLLEHEGRKITTPDDWNKAVVRIRADWDKVLGSPPERSVKLDVQTEKAEKLDGYTRTLVSIHTEGDDRLRGYLLVPEGLKDNEKRPAIVVFHPTTKDTLTEPVGLGQRKEMALALQLTKRGYITFSPECYIMKSDGAKAQAAALEKRRPGWTGLGKMTFDASRCLDYLETLPNVDAKRFGCIGHSLGAKEVLYATAFEMRFQVGVFNEGGIGLRMSNWTDVWYLTEKMKPRIPEMEHHQLLGLIAPRPFLILGGDSADGDASWAFVKAALPVYELLGAKERIGLHNHKAKHSYPKELRTLSYQWLDHWLKFMPAKEDVD